MGGIESSLPGLSPDSSVDDPDGSVEDDKDFWARVTREDPATADLEKVVPKYMEASFDRKASGKDLELLFDKLSKQGLSAKSKHPTAYLSNSVAGDLRKNVRRARAQKGVVQLPATQIKFSL